MTAINVEVDLRVYRHDSTEYGVGRVNAIICGQPVPLLALMAGLERTILPDNKCVGWLQHRGLPPRLAEMLIRQATSRLAPIEDDREGWDFFSSSGSGVNGDHVERVDEFEGNPPGLTREFAADEDAEHYVLYRTLAVLEQYVTDALQIDKNGVDEGGQTVKPVNFARRVLAAVGRHSPTLAAHCADANTENNESLRQLLRDQDWLKRDYRKPVNPNEDEDAEDDPGETTT